MGIRPPSYAWAVLAWTSAVCASLQPFRPVETGAAVVRRQACLANFHSCADQGAIFNGVCCQNGQSCALDANGNPACCPVNAICTGTAPASFVSSGPAPTTAVSYVSNVYFSFPYIATSFANPGHCSAAVSQCSANHAACTSQLGGFGSAGYAVTIVVPGGGGTTVTAGGGISVAPTAATSICNSLSSVACGGLQLGMCTMTGTTAGGFYFGTGSGNAAAAARPTAAAVAACAGLVGAVAVGAAGMDIL
ncbi:hypothetical protein N657DRAFT_13628 [Parathielavia appendiculata]|uniref:Gpi-anchored protein n=1 Tax=Parathielavia appendiculata TaxID=2587402 RepID=A0AAN6U8B1_9PEZI|nr:hypothetical protein N657DRAFT_13628 [Parathielavia appendiculata]